MEDIFDNEDNAKNIYVIRHKLAQLKRKPRAHFEYRVGCFALYIYTSDEYNNDQDTNDSLLSYEKVHIVLNEISKRNNATSSILLMEDDRFKDYEPIMYNIWRNPMDGSIINLSDGRSMPILQLCELIRLLHRLDNLTAFM